VVAGVGFEPTPDSSQAIEDQSNSNASAGGYTQIGAQISDEDCRSLSRVTSAWPRLSAGLKLAILAIVDAEGRKGGTG